ncbi:putative cytochrome P450 alkane hydroxylase [Lophiostoma macrostomum CBS 122681]|uniref:Putative cytochrome P450 alkane hydroxylase n=1 Tax=Lophiostoma macrostomum CBS 122681 TaxID=1314788 RepID=A0A6A6TFE9_9PLEO|nr:putative cytochrome P450 alkane hydroxylase [Lophiostoma macrostomum CBS 122681]
MAIFTFFNVAVSLTALLLSRRVYWEATTGARQRAFKRQHGCLPPKRYVSRVPILGLDTMVKIFQAFSQHRIMDFWRGAMTDQHAHLMGFVILGNELFLTDDPENVKAMLATQFSTWSIGKQRMEQMSEFLGNGVFTTEGAAWKHSRDLIRPCFEKSQVADFSILEDHTSQLISRIPSDGSTIDLQPLFQDLALDIATEFLFGRSTHCLRPDHDEDVKKFIASFEYCQQPQASDKPRRFKTLKVILSTFLPDRALKKHIKVVKDFADKIIDSEITSRSSTSQSSSPPPSRYVFLDELLSQTTDRTVLRSELLNILLAARDTTASLLSNVFFSLSRHPATLSRLRSEITSQIGSAQPTYQHLKDLKYLSAILKESQRLYPIVPMNSRQALQDTTLPHGGGPDGQSPVFVPKGGLVAYHPYCMHRRPDIYGPDADVFEPSRWMDNEHDSAPLRPGWAYLPFSGGPRVCIGQQFALTEASYVVVRLLQTFGEVESRDSEPWREKITVVCTGLGGCKVGLKKGSAV